MHECSEEDYAKFHKPDAATLKRLDGIKENGGMMCIDWKSDNIVLSGSEETDATHRVVDIMMAPCG